MDVATAGVIGITTAVVTGTMIAVTGDELNPAVICR